MEFQENDLKRKTFVAINMSNEKAVVGHRIIVLIYLFLKCYEFVCLRCLLVVVCDNEVNFLLGFLYILKCYFKIPIILFFLATSDNIHEGDYRVGFIFAG